MEKKTYYILLRDLEDPSSQSSAGMLWGMLSNYVYGTQPPLALKGELFESLPAADITTAGVEVEDKVAVCGLKQKCLQVECPKEDLQIISDKDTQLLLAVQSYHQRCRLLKDRQDLLIWAVADNEGCRVSVWMDELKRDVPAIVHYKGALPPYDGIMFGVEIVDPRFRNRGTADGVFRCQRYFRCTPGAGMFVSLDKITIPVAEEFNVRTEESSQDDYTHIEKEEKPNGEDSAMESSGHSLVEAELLEEKSRALILEAKSTTEDTEKQEKEKQLESKSLTREPEISDEGEVMDFQQLYLNEKKLQLQAQYQLKECKLKISSLEKHLDKEQIANKKLVEKCDALQKELSQQALLRTDAELKIEEEHNKIRKVQKCFEREWEEFERRLIEERAAKSEAEQQLSVLMRQLQEERNLKTVLQRDLDALQDKFSRQQEEFEKQRRIGEMAWTENAMHEKKTQPDLESSDWIISRSEVEIIEERGLGTGGWGVVKEGKFRGCKVAVKQIHELILSPHNRRLFVREMNIASRCRHPCLLQFIGATNDDGIPLFVTELMDTSLRDLLDKKPLPKADVVNIALDVARALNYLHLNRPSIIHRDISSANVLLWRRDNQWRAKVSDYGTANFMRQCKTINPGSVIYSAPEALSTEQSPKIDVFSFGLLLCEMCIRELPVPNHTQEQISMIADQVLRDLVTSCVRQEPGQRPTIAEAITVLEKVEP